MFVTVGDRVKKGQALFQIRQADYKRRVAEASAAYGGGRFIIRADGRVENLPTS